MIGRRRLRILLLASLTLVGFRLGAAAADPRPTESFVPAGALPQYERARDYDVIHTTLDLRFDWDRRAVEGKVTHRLAPLREGLQLLHFDQHRMTFQRITVAGREVESWTDGDTLTVDLGAPAPRGHELVVEIPYRVENPPEGMYWNIPDRHYPDRPRQIWTQGEDHENHFWFPCYDYPNDKRTTEEIVTVDRRYTVVGNGELVEQRDNGDGTATWHYRMDVPHATYLTSLVVGEYEVYEQEWDGIPILSYVRSGLRDQAERAFGRTAAMMRIMNEKIGVLYPYPVYRQIEVENFLFGGMENIAATTLTHRTLHDENAHQGYQSEGLVAHELAHAWWGDLVSASHWSENWLHEGIASYFEHVYWENDIGRDEMQWRMHQDLESYLSEDETYRRPMVTRYYADPGDLFDDVAYLKGSWVVHMLRRTLGEDIFWDALRTYAGNHHAALVETADLRRAAAHVSGRPLDRFFDQWVYRGGHPDLELSWDWDSDARLLDVTVKQTQKTDDLTPIFEVDLDLDVTGAGGEKRFLVTSDEAEKHFTFQVAERPEFVELDRDEWVVKTLSIQAPEKALAAQLRRSPALVSRARAADALGKKAGDVATAVLREALLDEKEHRGVRGKAALALGEIGGADARAALEAGLGTPVAWVRARIAEALGKMEGEAVLSRLSKLGAEDSSYHVAEAAYQALGEVKGAEARKSLRRGLSRDSWRDIIRRGAITGLGSLEDAEAIPIVTPYLAPGIYMETRLDACSAVAKLGAELEGEKRTDVRHRLETLLDDPIIQVRRSAARALGTLGDSKAVPALTRVQSREEHSSVKQAAREAIETIRTGKKPKTDELRDELDEVKREQRKLKEEVETLKRRAEASSAPAGEP